MEDTLVESCRAMLSDRGSTPLISTKKYQSRKGLFFYGSGELKDLKGTLNKKQSELLELQSQMLELNKRHCTNKISGDEYHMKSLELMDSIASLIRIYGTLNTLSKCRTLSTIEEKQGITL